MPHYAIKDLSDEKLMEQFIKERNPDVFVQIYNRYFVSLSKYIGWLTQDIEQGKDVTQLVFINLYNTPQLYDPAKNFKIWIFTVAKNRWKNEIRSHSIRKKHSEFASAFLSIDNEEKEEENINKLERSLKVKEKMKQLSDHHREVIVLKYSNNLTIKEISQVLDCNEGTVKSRLYYALKSLKELIL
ncbi:RNA polymerase sigma factor [Aquimarina sp. MMG016]|uniref:RNA polymerase sigma factor n=1 Tax=Aquimarina sp. MMG016 TaxID=2822690 RepID=UPI001B39FC79|nr:RNA polymerase sigma factor [Aquimarina sp. MMG016]MBQ4819079.1 RNA polymerase sigma factor [Aquimarina sp. MMG016]